jgi:hypothetical protein
MGNPAVKDLRYYLEHTDEMPTDPKELERLANEHMDLAMESGTEVMNVDKIVGEQPPEPAANKPAEVQAEPEKPAEPAKAAEAAKPAEPAAEVKPDGILAKDGKNVIPYSQLETARQRAATAEALARAQAEELAALKAQKPAPAAEPEFLTADELAALEADSPTLAKQLRTQQAAIQSLRETVATVTQSVQSRVAAEEAEAKSDIQTAIDGNAVLASWQTSEDQSLWAEATRFDKLLRESPKYANVPYAERFAKVVELTQNAMGLEVPKPAEAEQPTQEQIKAAALDKLKKVAAKSTPTTLSQIPGGAPPAVDELAKVEGMSPTALGNQFLNMTKDQMEAYLSTL